MADVVSNSTSKAGGLQVKLSRLVVFQEFICWWLFSRVQLCHQRCSGWWSQIRAELSPLQEQQEALHLSRRIRGKVEVILPLQMQKIQMQTIRKETPKNKQETFRKRASQSLPYFRRALLLNNVSAGLLKFILFRISAVTFTANFAL